MRFSISAFHVKKPKTSLLFLFANGTDSVLGGFRVRGLQVGILEGMETLKSGIFKAAVILPHAVTRKNAAGIRGGARFSSESLQRNLICKWLCLDRAYSHSNTFILKQVFPVSFQEFTFMLENFFRRPPNVASWVQIFLT